MDLVLKLAMCVALYWLIHEISQVDKLINYRRLTNFLRHVKNAIWLYIGLRISAASIEYCIRFRAGWFSISVSGLFFVILSLIIRFRRQKLANEWNRLPEYNEEVFNEGIQTLETTVCELQAPHTTE